MDEELGPHPTGQLMLSLIPKYGPLVADWRKAMFEREQRRAQLLGETASAEIGMSELLERLAQDEVLSDMFREAVETAVRTSSDLKIRLLGRVLAAAAVAKDEAKVDETQELLRIAEQLEAVDVRALVALSEGQPSDPAAFLSKALDTTEVTTGPIAARLQRLSLIRVERESRLNDAADKQNDFVDIEEAWFLTTTALALLELLETGSA
jgi:hypothetical protein